MAEKRYTVVFDAKDNASARLSAMEQQARKTSRGMDDLANKTEKVSDVTERLDGAYRDANGRLRDANGKFLKMSDVIKQTNNEMDRSGGLLSRMGSGISRMGTEGRGAVGRLATGLSGVTGILGGITAAAGLAGVALTGLAAKGVVNGMIQPAMTAEMTRMSIDGLSGDPVIGKQIYEQTKSAGMESMFADQPFMDTAQMFLNSTKDPEQIAQGVAITERLATKNPSEAMGGGMEGAKVAISEVMSGDMTSIAERFNMSRSTLKEAGVSASNDWLTNLQAVDNLLSSQGFTSDYVKKINESTTGQWEKFKSNSQGVFASIGTGMLEEIRPALKQMNRLFADTEGMDRFTSSMSGKFQGLAADVFGLGNGVQITWDNITNWSVSTFDGVSNVMSSTTDMFGTMITAFAGGDLTKPQETFANFGSVLDGIARKIDSLKQGFIELDQWGDKMTKFTEIGQKGGIQKSIDDGAWWLPEGAKGGRGLIPWALEGFPSERKKDGSHALGLSYVPKNKYNAELHEGERVLTKQENIDYTQGAGNQSSGGVVITGNTFNVRSDSDIDAIGEALYMRLQARG
ncbi:hypothetical protein [Exiguobacterium sp. S22-S28]|uniref:hypothetical protein n=1 Tax=Exiguobacterium sp. S22-S28 TaxID=3342768 RepID=UPI00372CF488